MREKQLHDGLFMWNVPVLLFLYPASGLWDHPTPGLPPAPAPSPGRSPDLCMAEEAIGPRDLPKGTADPATLTLSPVLASLGSAL